MSYLPTGDAAAGSDPFVTYGRDAAATILRGIRRLPSAQRKPTLYAVLDAIDPSLKGTIESKAAWYQAAGHSPSAALEKSIAASFANGAMDELIRIGRNQRPGPLMKIGLGDDAPATVRHGQFILDGQTISVTVYPDKEIKGSKIWQVTSGGWNALKTKMPKSLVASIEARGIKPGQVLPFGMIDMRPALMAARYPISKIQDGNGIYVKFDKGYPYQLGDVKQVVMSIKKIPHADSLLDIVVKAAILPITLQLDLAGKIIETAAPAVKGLLGQLGGAACQLLNTGGVQFAAAAGGAVYGGTAGASAGMTGANVAQSACNDGGSQAPPPPPAPAPFPILPIALVGGGALLLYALSGKKSSPPPAVKP